MIGELFNNPLAFVLQAAALLIAITVHEFSHALAAERLGDPTPRLMGRLTLNPGAHLDPLGTIMLLFVGFGWGKPVPFDPFNLRNPQRDSALISLAGPASNFSVAIVCSVFLRILSFSFVPTYWFIGLLDTLLIGILSMNVMLGVFNLIPIHPLDGFKIVGGLLPKQYAVQWDELERYGMIFLLFLLFPIFGGTAPIQQILSPMIHAVLSVLLPNIPVI